MQRKILPGLRVLPTVQRKSNGTSWLHQQPVRPVNGRSLIQPKVKVHAANDRFEKEADHVADMVVGKSASPAPVRVSSVSKGAQRKPIAQAKKIIQRKTNRNVLQGADNSPPASPDISQNPLESVLSNQQTRGSPLPATTRSTMESRMGADFSNVRIHTSQASHDANASIGARAFTNGNHIHFARGQFSPGTRAGQHLLAHELTHTIQQGASPVMNSNTRVQRSIAISSVSTELTAGRGPPLQAKDGETAVQCSLLDNAVANISSVLNDLPSITEGLTGAKAWLLRKLRQFALYIPGYRALGVVLSFDPITGEGIERNGRNFIEAALDIIPGGNLLKQKLEELGVIDRAATWIDTQIETLSGILGNVRQEFTDEWNRLGLLSILEGPLDILRNFGRIFERAINNLISFATRAASELLAIVKQFLLTQIVNFIKNHTNAYELLKVIIGKDPITDEPVARNGTNILNALLELGGEQGREQRRQMQDTGTFQKAADWIDRGIAVFGNLYQTIRNNFGMIWNIVSIQALMDPVGVFTQIYNTFAEPVRQVLSFVVDTLRIILGFIKEVLLQRLSAWARTVRGYALVTVIIGKDPFTNAVVPRTIPNIIRGFMSLMDGGEEQYRQMEESGAIARTTQRIEAAVARLNMTPAVILQLFIDLWNSFSFSDLSNPITAFQRIINRFGEPIARLVAFIVEIVKIVVHTILEIMNFPFDLINNIIARSLAAFDRIKRDPISFLKNLLRAIKQGFIQFFNNIVTHLINGVVGWLMSELRDANVPAPQDLSLRGIISWVLQVLGISMEAIWQKLAAHPRIGPERVARLRGMIDRLEGIWNFIRDVQQRGIAAIWDKIQEQLSNLWNTVLNAIKNWIMERIVAQVTARLLSMLDPTGIMAVINSAIAIYRAVQSFIRYLRQMLEVVNSFVNGVADIAEGNVSTAANYLERTMGRAMPIVIGFLANQVGLSGIGRRIGEMITAVRQMVDRAITWLVNRAVDTGFAIFDRLLSIGRSAASAVSGFFGRLLGIRRPFNMNGENHSLFFRQSGNTVELMMASEPQTVRAFLTNQLTVNANNPTKLATVRSAQAQLSNIERIYNNILVAQSRGDANQDASTRQYNDLNSAIGVLVTHLSSLGTALAPTGRSNNPLDAIEMVWYKPTSLYPLSITLTTTGQRIFFNEPELVTIPDIRSLQNLRNEGFADRQIRIGVPSSSIFWPAIGKVWPRVRSGVVRTGTVQAQFRRLLRELGYAWGNNEADHVRDLQWRGEDHYSNLWPLDAGHNNAANRILNQNVRYQDNSGNIVTVPLNATPLDLYFRIVGFQTKSKNKLSNDRFEREADKIADKVVANRTDNKVETITSVRENTMSVKQATPSGSISNNRLPDTRGSPLPSSTRKQMESRIGADFSNVRIHTGPASQQATAAINARAMTQGNNIHFGSGEFNPGSKDGKRLLVHELVHTVQQGASAKKDVSSKSSGGSSSKAAKVVVQEIVAEKVVASKPGSAKPIADLPKAGDGKKEKNKSPSSPEEDPAFQMTIKKARSRTRSQSSTPDPQVKANDAQFAAVAVPYEAESKAQNRKSNKLGATAEAINPSKPFDPAALKKALLEKIEEITPDNLEEADEFKEKNRIHEVKSEVNSKVAEEKKNTVGPVDVVAKAPLDTNANENKKDLKLPPTDKGARPAGIAAANAAPKPKTDDEISMQEQSASLDDEMKKNNVTEDQLQGSNEPTFQSAVKEKKNAQKDAVEKPIMYRQQEAAELNAAKAEAGNTAAASLGSMFGLRGKNFETVVGQQGKTKKGDEEKRAKVASDINEKYKATEGIVNDRLNEAEKQSGEIFDTGAEAARKIFENYVGEEMRKYKADRYSGWLGGGRWLKDKLFDLPDTVNKFYVVGKQLYLDKMDKVLTDVTNLIAEKLNAAKKAIEDGKKDIDEYVGRLPKELEDVGAEALEKIKDQFDSLEQKVTDKGQQLVDGFAKKYVDNVKKLDERITELKEANKGLVSKAIGMLKAVWRVLKNIYDLFRTILSKLAQIVGIILGAPGKFFGNLGAAFNKGFDMFTSRIDEHLENGLMIWLSTQLGVANIKLPPKFDIGSIFGLALEVMGINYAHIRERAVMKIGEERVALMETTAGLFKRIYDEGIGVIWDIIKEKLTDFKDMIWEAIKTFIRDAVIKAAITFLLSLLNPIAAFVKACMAIYDFLMMLVKMKDRIIDLVNSILDAVILIANGTVDAAAAAIEKAFAKSIPIIIGFLAALLHLNNIGAKVREIILRIRTRVDKVLDWMIDKVYGLISPAIDTAMRVKNKGKQLIEKGKEKVKDAVSTVVSIFTPWRNADKEFKTDSGESHKIYVEAGGSKPNLMVASVPTTIPDFLDYWEKRPGVTAKKLAIIEKARNHHLTLIVPLLTQVKASEDRNEPEANRTHLLKELLKQNSQLSMFIKELIGSSIDLSGVKERYGLEGMTGRYNAMPEARGDQFEADHQPQNSALEYASQQPCFASVFQLKRRAASRAALGWTINLHELRHRQGRTYGRAPPTSFTNAVDRVTSSNVVESAKRRAIVDLLKEELRQDVDRMETVASRPLSDPVWNDLKDPAMGLNPADQQKVRDQISANILKGQRQMANQEMDNLAT